MIAHSLVLMSNQVKELQAANKATSRCKSRKRKRMQTKGTLTAKEGVRLTTLKEFTLRSNRKKAKKSARAKGSELTQRRCGRCNKARHNSRTCKQGEEILSN
jgi:hypothetical protein